MFEGVAVAGRRRVERDTECVGDLLEGQLTPGFHGDDLPQMFGQGLHGAGEFSVEPGVWSGDGRGLEPRWRGKFTALAAVVAAAQINRPAANGPENQCVIRRALPVAALPGFNERILQDVVRIGLATRLRTGEKQEAGPVGFEPRGPGWGSDGIVHTMTMFFSPAKRRRAGFLSVASSFCHQRPEVLPP